MSCRALIRPTPPSDDGNVVQLADFRRPAGKASYFTALRAQEEARGAAAADLPLPEQIRRVIAATGV